MYVCGANKYLGDQPDEEKWLPLIYREEAIPVSNILVCLVNNENTGQPCDCYHYDKSSLFIGTAQGRYQP